MQRQVCFTQMCLCNSDFWTASVQIRDHVSALETLHWFKCQFLLLVERGALRCYSLIKCYRHVTYLPGILSPHSAASGLLCFLY